MPLKLDVKSTGKAPSGAAAENGHSSPQPQPPATTVRAAAQLPNHSGSKLWERGVGRWTSMLNICDTVSCRVLRPSRFATGIDGCRWMTNHKLCSCKKGIYREEKHHYHHVLTLCDTPFEF